MRRETSGLSLPSLALSFLLFSFISIRDTIYGRSWRWMRIASVERRFWVGVHLLLLSLLSASGGYGVFFFFLVKYPVVDMHLIDIILAPFSQLFYCRSTPFEDLTCFMVENPALVA
jgi:hypothetical protein